jgi:hypothetical protein
LRTILGGPEKKTLGSAVTAKKGAGKVSKKKTLGAAAPAKKRVEQGSNGKQKKINKKAEKSKKAVVPKETVEDSIEKIARSMPEVRKAAVPAKKATTSAKKQAPKKKKKEMANNKNEATKKEEKQQPDLISTDGSSGAHQDEGETDKTVTAPLNIPIYTESAEDGGGWQTVSKSKIAAVQEATAEAKVESASDEVKEDPMPELVEEEPTPTELVEELVTEVKEDNGKSQPINGSSDAKVETEAPVEEKAAGTSAPNNSNKKKKKKKNAAQSTPSEERTPSTGSVGSTDSDAALALLLQKEEENLARAQNKTEIVEVWEEVATKKKKGK